MFRLVLLFLGVSLSLNAAVEFSSSEKVLRSILMYPQIEAASQDGLLGEKQFSFWLEKELLSDYKSGEVTSFEQIDFFCPEKDSLRISLKGKAMLSFDFENKQLKILSGSFERESASVWGRSAGVGGETEVVGIRRVSVNEYLWSVCELFKSPDRIQDTFLRLIEIATHFNIELVCKNSKTVISFDQGESEDVAALKKVNWRQGRQLHKFKEGPQNGEIIIELCRDVGKHTRYVVRMALKKSELPRELLQKYPGLR